MATSGTGSASASTTSRPSRPSNARLAPGPGRAGTAVRPHVRVTITTGTGNNSNLARLDLKNKVVVLEFVPLGSRSDQDGDVRAVRVPLSVREFLGPVWPGPQKRSRCAPSTATRTTRRARRGCRCSEQTPGRPTVSVTKATQMTSSEREFDALHAVRKIDSSLIRYILDPSHLVAMKEVYETKRRRELWPREAGQEAFVKFLKSRYDHRQLEAIEMTACQLSVHLPDSKHSSLSTKLPFVLIQDLQGLARRTPCAGCSMCGT